MKTDSNPELTALQNFANKFELKVKLFFMEDQRKKTKYILTKNDNFISPPLNYNELNHFLLGINECKKYNL
tara:strand:+ start:69 stop:281 length:213 start_codon:yes stop_codon:yes gene_type:complete